MPIFQGKQIKLLRGSNFICVRPLATLQKSQDYFQIPAHVSLISEMLVAHRFSKISPESEMKDLRVSFELRF